MREFVGREQEISTFTAMLGGESANQILNVTGIGGIGKSTLVEEFDRIARAAGNAVGIVNARQLTNPNDIHNYPVVVETLTILERELRGCGCETRGLASRLEQYRQLHRQLTQKFDGHEQPAVSTILQVGVSAIRAGATIFPVAQPLTAVLTPELATKVSQAIAGYRKEGDRKLLSQPIEELTSLFLAALNSYVRGHNRRAVLIFDEFELVQVTVGQWLRQCFSNVFGALDNRIILVVAGRLAIGQDWTARGQSGAPSLMRHVQLGHFSDGEITEYLLKSEAGIEEDEARSIAASLTTAYRLPLVLRLLINDREYLRDAGRKGGRLGYIADEIADRFLDESSTTPQQRQIALSAAVSRRFDAAILRALEPDLDNSTAQGHMQWLTKQHFINPHSPAYSYYDLVRQVFLGHLENTDRMRLDELHAQLARHYDQLLARGSQSERMRNMSIEHAYHRLSGPTGDVLSEALNLLLGFLPAAHEYGMSWSRMLRQVIEEQDDLAGSDRERLNRLAGVLERSSLLGALPGPSGAEKIADPALNILFTSSFDDSLPVVTATNAELWLTYFESRFKSVTGGASEISEAFADLLRVWQAAEDLTAIGSNESLLAFRVASDLADIYTRRGDLANALEYSERAVAIAKTDNAPIREAFALYQLSNNQKRQGAYRLGLESLSMAIDLVRRHPNQATPYYLGRFLLDKAITLTYVADTIAAEEAFEASRAMFSDVSPVSHAELSHRLGWLKRIRGDLHGALSDHEMAIGGLRDIQAGLGVSPTPSNVSYLLAKALHSLGNVYAEMCAHGKALEHYEEALRLFTRQGGVRHQAIVRKDRAWSRFVASGPAAAEGDLSQAISQLGPMGSETDRPAVNSTTHLAEGWLMLSLIQGLTGRLDEATAAIERVTALIGSDDNPPLHERAQLQRALISALRGETQHANTLAAGVVERALAQQPPQWMLAARAASIEAAAACAVGDEGTQEERLAIAAQWAADWNEFGPRAIGEWWTLLAGAVAKGNPRTAPRRPAVLADSSDEMMDVYDEKGYPLGQASNHLAHRIGLWHRSFHCWIVRLAEDGTKLVLLQRRGPGVGSFSNFFDMSSAGHYRAGEGIEGGVRECKEELGIDVRKEELRPIARRVINEAPNGAVNREFQDIYMLLRPAPASSYRPGFPEVSAVVECRLLDLWALVEGTTESVAFSGVLVGNDSDEATVGEGRLTRADLIADSRAYHRRVLRVLAENLEHVSRADPGNSTGYDSPADNSTADNRTGPVEYLPDGSRWMRLT
jgi:tetratricopeptide (TPR) repeat protein/8-oxo-dGTP pyrophosphatase MutT (NUDIX family)